MTTIAALIPMRHHSQRVPGKNFRVLAGKPLYHYILATLAAVPEINQLVVDTDSDVIMGGLRENFPAVTVVERPHALRADDVPMNEILIHDTGQIDADFYLQTHTTNPLLRADTIARAIKSFRGSYPTYDSMFSVTRLQRRLYDQAGTAINHDPTELIQTQNLPPVYEENSCLYMFTRDGLLAGHHRIGRHPLMFEMDAEEAWDIDDELDLEICEFLLKRNITAQERTG